MDNGNKINAASIGKAAYYLVIAALAVSLLVFTIGILAEKKMKPAGMTVEEFRQHVKSGNVTEVVTGGLDLSCVLNGSDEVIKVDTYMNNDLVGYV